MKPHEQIISRAMMQLVATFIANQTPFSLVIKNTQYWKDTLPSYLSTQEFILLEMDNTDLEESYIDNNQCVLTLGIDGIVYKGTLTSDCIYSIGLLRQSPLIEKQFHESPDDKTPIQGSIQHSLNCLYRLNPHLLPVPTVS